MVVRFIEKILFFLLAGSLGFFLSVQVSSIHSFRQRLQQDEVNPYFELQAVLNEYVSLEKQANAEAENIQSIIANESAALDAERRIETYQKRAGFVSVTDPHVRVLVRGSMNEVELLRFIHESFSYGAQGIALQNKLYTSDSYGLETVSGGGIFFDDVSLQFPLIIDIYGALPRLEQVYFSDSPVLKVYSDAVFTITKVEE